MSPGAVPCRAVPLAAVRGNSSIVWSRRRLFWHANKIHKKHMKDITIGVLTQYAYKNAQSGDRINAISGGSR
jgi:hypothetical protein